VSKAIDEKLVWLDNFNKSIIDYDKICKELEEIVVKDRKDLDALIKPEGAFKATDRLRSQTTSSSCGTRDCLLRGRRTQQRPRNLSEE